jgi:hypothetical protein
MANATNTANGTKTPTRIAVLVLVLNPEELFGFVVGIGEG